MNGNKNGGRGMRMARTIAAGMILFAAPFCALAESKIFDHTVDQPFAGGQSPDDAYIAAITKAKFEVLELAGTYLESLSVVENAMLTQDEVTALAGGVLKTEVVKRENYANDKTFGIILTTRIEVDTGVLQQRMNKLLTDRTLLRKYNEIQEREKELLARLRQLEALTAGQGGQPAQSNFMDNRFTEMSAALSASQWLEKAYALWSHGRFAEPLAAIDNLNRAISLDDQNPRAFNSRAVAYLDLGRYREAEEDLRKALELKPDYADAHNNLGTLHYRLRNFREAVASYSHAIDFKADFSEALLNRGLAYGKMLLFEQAVRDFQRAMQLTPNFKKSNDAGALAELNDIGVLCARARTACGLNLCRSLNFLRERGFCLEENIQSNLNP